MIGLIKLRDHLREKLKEQGIRIKPEEIIASAENSKPILTLKPCDEGKIEFFVDEYQGALSLYNLRCRSAQDLMVIKSITLIWLSKNADRYENAINPIFTVDDFEEVVDMSISIKFTERFLYQESSEGVEHQGKKWTPVPEDSLD